MRTRMLGAFVVVAEKGTITEAAKVLNISQPALTKGMKRLEEEVGVKLFTRASSGIQLTRYGDILLEHARIMENEYRHAMTRIDELHNGRQVSLRLGAGPALLVSVLPPLIAKFQVDHPNVSISLTGGVIDTLLPDLIAGNLDVICTALDFPNNNMLIKQPLFDSAHVLIAAPNHELVNVETVKASHLHDQSWMVLKSDLVGNERILSFFSAHGLRPPHITFETTSFNSLLHALKSGAHLAHIPEHMLDNAIELGLRKIDMKDSIWETTVGYAYRKTTHMTKPIRVFLNALDTLAQGRYQQL